MFGMGLRHSHFSEILSRLENSQDLGVDFFEIITENFFQTKGRPLRILEQVRAVKPITFHGVSLSIASAEEINFEYLESVKRFEQTMRPMLVSDHLCWTGMKNTNLHNLLPFPYTEETLKFIAPRIQKVQEFLGRPLMLENLSAYLSFKESLLSEAQFLRELHQRTGCEILLDLNNVYVNGHNQNFDPALWIREIPVKAVKEIHLAGYSDMGKYYFDTHSCPVWPEVWKLYSKFKKEFPDALTLVEWDEDIPSYPTVLGEVEKARAHAT